MDKLNLLVATFIVSSVSWLFAADDAQYVSCVIPETLITDEIFQAQITMRNTGTTTWGSGTPATLVSQSPKCNMTWGTYFIIMGQGNTTAPGASFTFSSKLRAPSTPGTYNFGWQIERCQSGGGYLDTTAPFFGDIVTGESIYIMQRTETPPDPPAHVDSLLDSSDLEYMGSFALPNLSGEEDKYTESGLALKDAGGSKNLLVRTGTYDYRLYETTIPALVKITNGSSSGINTGSVVQDWGDLGYGTIGGEGINSNCGFWFEDSSNILFWSHYNAYYTGGASDFPQLMATRLNAGGTKTNLGYWHVPGNKGPYKSYWGGPLKLSANFAATYTGGREMAVGFGGYYSICGSASRGPAIGAIARPSGASGGTLDLVAMMTYTDPAASVRDGNYIPVVGFWDTDPPTPWQGLWTYDDICHAGVFIDLPDKHGYLAFVQQVIGRIGYDYGGYNTDGHEQNCLYFYDLKDLGAAALGTKQPDSVQPSSFVTFEYPTGGGAIQGACFDSASRTIYVYQQWAADNGEPLVHVYRIKETPAAVEANAASAEEPEITVCPNPFNPTVSISVGQVNSGIQMAVYDVSGRAVADLSTNLVHGHVLWNASGQPSGVYIVKAVIGNRTLTKAITLMK